MFVRRLLDACPASQSKVYVPLVTSSMLIMLTIYNMAPDREIAMLYVLESMTKDNIKEEKAVPYISQLLTPSR
jgi:hypothetical protein